MKTFRGWTITLLAVGVVSMLESTAGRAMAEQPAEPSAAAVAQPDKEVETLLQKVEQQILSGKTVTLDSNNALTTWGQMLDKVFPFSPAKAIALEGFVGDLKNRAARENAAGRQFVAIDLSLFAEQALKLLADQKLEQRTSANASSANPPSADAAQDVSPTAVTTAAAVPVTRQSKAADLPAPATMPPDPPRTAGGGIPTAPHDGISGATVASLTPSPIAPEMHAAGPAPLIPPAPAPAEPPRSSNSTTSAPLAEASLCAERGAAMLAIKDISAARKFYECAANAGNAQAAVILGQTYDSKFASWIGAVGIKPDPAAAAAWYRKAAALNDQAAARNLQSASADPGK